MNSATPLRRYAATLSHMRTQALASAVHLVKTGQFSGSVCYKTGQFYFTIYNNDLARARSYVASNPRALIEAIERVRDGGESLTEPVERALRSLRVGRWFHLRHAIRYALLLDERVQHAYAVKALTNPLHGHRSCQALGEAQ